MCAASRKHDGKIKELVLWVLQDKAINRGGQEFGGVGILVKEEISGNIVEVKRKSDRVMATLGREVMRIICAYLPQSRRPYTESLFL